MKGDFSRLTFDRSNHDAGVLHQQGRVWLDSDWNEEVLERLDLAQQALQDLVGLCGVPTPGTAFRITPNPDPAKFAEFQIGGGANAAGRAYVAGLLCRNEAITTYLSQPDLPDPPPIALAQGMDNYGLVYLEVLAAPDHRPGRSLHCRGGARRPRYRDPFADDCTGQSR